MCFKISSFWIAISAVTPKWGKQTFIIIHGHLTLSAIGRSLRVAATFMSLTLLEYPLEICSPVWYPENVQTQCSSTFMRAKCKNFHFMVTTWLSLPTTSNWSHHHSFSQGNNNILSKRTTKDTFPLQMVICTAAVVCRNCNSDCAIQDGKKSIIFISLWYRRTFRRIFLNNLLISLW